MATKQPNAKKVLNNVLETLTQARQYKAYAEANEQKERVKYWSEQIMFLENLIK